MQKRRKELLKKAILHKYYMAFTLFWLLQKNSLTKGTVDTKSDLEKEKSEFSRIRCPLCEWKPNSSNRWYCCDCNYPEYFFGGCHTSWNTFLTRGRCPGCNHQWKWTSCLSCADWSLHEDWYVKET